MIALETKKIPLSLYVHTPWCVQKCPYCDFNSYTAGKAVLPEAPYIDALLRDLEHDQPWSGGRALHSIFIGGGTPSLLSPSSYAHLLNGIRQQVPLAAQCEITLEANPGTVEQGRFRAYRELGINRLSLGVQSFQDKKLKRLGRIHGGDEAKRAIEQAREAGFDNINIDLMYGLPEQTQADCLQDLNTALAYAPAHLSWYHLTIEPNTVFFRQPPPQPDSEAIAAYEAEAEAVFAAAGFERYEVSAYATAGKRCWHNLNYWQFGDYLGIGAGAHSKLTCAQTQQVFRVNKHRTPHAYLRDNQDFIARKQILTRSDLRAEFMLGALRLAKGFPPSLWEQRTGQPFSVLAEPLAQAEHLGLLAVNDDSICPTETGWHFLNDTVALFFADTKDRVERSETG